LLQGDGDRPESPGKQLILFFRVGGNWMDVAWVLFDGLQSDPETVRMIRDIQLKNPGGLSDQVSTQYTLSQISSKMAA